MGLWVNAMRLWGSNSEDKCSGEKEKGDKVCKHSCGSVANI